ncbi:hypothetical protein AB0F03_13475 [Streptomyces sp. NPDC028722]|uniref:hypothetical protein n=1 Tax=unclassified Streptomyces TaxID=2593676 RepID=UPI0033E58FBF
MRKFQRAAVVAAAVAGLSALGAGVGFAGEGAPPAVTAVATSSANALAVGGGYYAPSEERHQPEGQPEEQKNHGPEHGYGEQHGEGE